MSFGDKDVSSDWDRTPEGASGALEMFCSLTWVAA